MTKSLEKFFSCCYCFDLSQEISVGENVRKEIVEKIVEREVIKEVEVKVGISEEEMEEINRKAAQEKELLMRQAQQDMKALIEQNSRTAQEREELQAAFAKEAEAKKALEEQKHSLASKLKVGIQSYNILTTSSKWKRNLLRVVR